MHAGSEYVIVVSFASRSLEPVHAQKLLVLVLALLPHGVALLLDLFVVHQLVLHILLEHEVNVVKVGEVLFVFSYSDSQVLEFTHVPISLDFRNKLPGCLVLLQGDGQRARVQVDRIAQLLLGVEVELLAEVYRVLWNLDDLVLVPTFQLEHGRVGFESVSVVSIVGWHWEHTFQIKSWGSSV